jgi:hypothetical protein
LLIDKNLFVSVNEYGNKIYVFCKNAKKEFNFRGAKPPYDPLLL